MSSQPYLLPAPRQLTLSEGVFTLPQRALIVISDPKLLFEAQRLQAALKEFSQRQWDIVAGSTYRDIGVELIIDDSFDHPQGYQLTITSLEINITAADAAGIFYGVCTLVQLLQQYGASLPCLTVHDWPDYPARGIMLDISRDKVPTLQTILDLVERLAALKINQLQLYMEHTFAYRQHPEVWSQATPFTGEDILILDAFCRQRHVELVPNQNSLGHMERWLKHQRYHHLAECPDGFEAPWGGFSPPTTLNPLDPGSLSLMASLYDELLPHFTSENINVGGDEPWELGKGKSKEAVEARGGRVYLDYIKSLHNEISAHGRKMQFWGDIIVHYPELVPELPPDVTAMLWGYEGGEKAAQEWERQCTMLESAKIPFYVCPGTSSWNTIAGRSDNAIDNCRISAASGLKHGAVGYLITDWGDNGHWQPFSISYLGFAYGAAVAWCLASNNQIELPPLLDRFIFNDTAGIMGRLSYDLGEIYKLIGPEHINGQILAYTLQQPTDKLQQSIKSHESWGGKAADVKPETLRRVAETIKQVIEPLSRAQMQREDASIVAAEFQQAADLLLHSTHRLLFVFDEEGTPEALLSELQPLVEKQSTLWHNRNRSGGLDDSLRRFEIPLNEYKSLSNT
ncbi:MAG: family 20 glycosylhydrolase [Chloroflexi bacterium]|nr:family 20 glycosylhydrolase [Chloroflexota bacterium]MCC6894084.1 family 20 glycosylhydrolase [Anaerolineae bacterium]